MSRDAAFELSESVVRMSRDEAFELSDGELELTKPMPGGDPEFDDRCISCGADVDHYLGCPDDPTPDYEAEAEVRDV